MGVAGSGKTTIGPQLARALDLEFVEGDSLHPQANVKKMAAGIPLTDDDRRPWLIAIAHRLAEAKRAGTGLVVSCSALKRSYRDLLRSEGPADVQFVFLKSSPTLIAERIVARRGHFMPASLVDSQFAALEEPTADEHVWVYDATRSPDEIVADVVRRAA